MNYKLLILFLAALGLFLFTGCTFQGQEINDLAGTVCYEPYGCTGTSTYVVGDMLYSDVTNRLGSLPIGSAGEVLKITGGVPAWGTDIGAGASTQAWEYIWAGAITPTTTSAGLFVTASSTFQGSLRVDGNATTTNHLAALGGNSDQWNLAYSWGDHSLAGYAVGNLFNQWLDTTSSPTFANIEISGIATTTELCFADGTCQSTVNPLSNEVIFYFHDEAGADGYELMLDTGFHGIDEDSDSCAATTGYCDLGGYITATTTINTVTWPAGTYHFELYADVNSVAGDSRIIATVFSRTTAGVETQQFQATSTELTTEEAGIYGFNSTEAEITTSDPSDRMVVKLKGYTDSAAAKTITYYYEGMAHASHFHTTFSNSIELGNYTQSNIDETITGDWDFPVGSIASSSLNWSWATTSEQYFWNTTSTWAAFQSEWDIKTNASTTIITQADMDADIATHTAIGDAHQAFGNWKVVTDYLTTTSSIGIIVTPSSTLPNLVVSDSITLYADAIIDSEVVDALTISGGTIEDTTIGAVTPSTGEFSAATTSDSFYVETERVYGDDDRSFSVSSSTINFTSQATSTIPIDYNSRAKTITDIYCITDAGIITIRIGDGTNYSEYVTCDNDGESLTPPANNTYTAREAMKIEAGNMGATMNWVTVNINENYD